ncbi:hypothetical protein DPEC_G00172550 [Dallia pectoralis]|uniref:Uncharacterized protein n=1 Tax=Dallia pectoralis TaxID=75939 RepID=A0ACC2GDW0_DALPE|nr:hypothetical protein DPEC_G00172550 [Dallia pectoralis]
MLFRRYRFSLWILTAITSYFQLLGAVSSDSLPGTLPAPSLIFISSIVKNPQGPLSLVCRAPGGHGGTMFRLNRATELLKTENFPAMRQEAHFTVPYSGQDDLFCCLYQNSLGVYSQYSPFATLARQGSFSPSSPSSPPPPLLSVQPPGGQVKRGDTLSFHCTPPPSRQSVEPVAFLLLRTTRVTEGSMVRPRTHLTLRSRSGPLRLGPVRSGEGGSYTCVYQVVVPQQGLVNSTASLPVQVTVTEVLPPPALSLDNHKGESVLLCTGSASYPGALFSLYRLGSTYPAATRNAPVTRNYALFPLSSLREDPIYDQYQCQYSVLLGSEWSHSELTEPLAVPRVTGQTSVDWPLILGSLSALVLFFMALVVLGLAVKRKVNSIVEEKRKREVALFWTKLQSQDHTVDHTLKPISISFEEWGSDDREAERSPGRRSFSTFGNTSHL